MGKLYVNTVRLLCLVIVALVIINILTIAHFQRSTVERENTLIINEVFRGSGGLSSSDKEKVKDSPLDKRRKNESKLMTEDGLETENDKPISPGKEEERSARNGASRFRKVKTTQAAQEYEMKDEKIDELVEKLRTNGSNFFPSYFESMSFYNLSRVLGSLKRKTAKHLYYYGRRTSVNGLPNWKRVHRGIRQFSLYDPDDPAVDGLLHDMATQPFIEAEENDGGTELKITMRLKDEGRAILKPMRWPREVEANQNHYIFDDMERHIAEIAAFQLDRLLGFYRVPPTIGRRVNITSELEPLVPKSIRKTIFVSPAGNVCFYGQCDYYCDSAHAFCGNPDVIEVSLMSYLPSRNVAKRSSWYQPYRRSYSKFSKAYWETHDDLCEQMKKKPPFNNGKMLGDLIDAHTFDFLTGNKDRHSFAFFTEFGNYSFPIMYDNGRGFGRKTYDAMSILAPLRQCCVIRKSTLLKYLKLYLGPYKLSDLMEKALATDPVAPVLVRGHLTALDRRLLTILRTVAKCSETRPISQIALDDKF